MFTIIMRDLCPWGNFIKPVKQSGVFALVGTICNNLSDTHTHAVQFGLFLTGRERFLDRYVIIVTAFPRLSVFKQVITVWGDEVLCTASKGCQQCGHQTEVQDNDCSDISVNIISFFIYSDGLWVRSRFLFSAVIPRQWPLLWVKSPCSCVECEEKITWERFISPWTIYTASDIGGLPFVKWVAFVLRLFENWHWKLKMRCLFCISYRHSITCVPWKRLSVRNTGAIFIYTRVYI